MRVMTMMIKNNPSSPFTNSILKRTGIFHLLHFSHSSTSQDQNPSPKSNFIRHYLISSFGFSPQKATTAAKSIASMTSAEKPDSVRHFLKHHGFTDANISSIVSLYPQTLNTDVDETMEPNLKALMKLGLSEHQLLKLIVSNPRVLTSRSAVPRIKFWRSFFGGDKQQLFLAFTRNRSLINLDIDKNVAPKMSLLKEYGFSKADIRTVIVRSNGLIKRGTESMEALLKRTQDMGFHVRSKMFLHGLTALGRIEPHMFTARLKFFESFGWSEEEFLVAFRKFPYFPHLAEEHIREKMEFLVRRAGLTHSYIASRPFILGFSLQKRLMPRHHVVKILKSGGFGKDWDFYSVMSLADQKFVQRVILPFKEEVPTLLETYTAFCAGEIQAGDGGD